MFILKYLVKINFIFQDNYKLKIINNMLRRNNNNKIMICMNMNMI